MKISFKRKLLVSLLLFILLCLCSLYISSENKMDKLLNLAENGDSNAQFEVALAYRDGYLDVEQDFDKYLEWLNKAASNNNDLAKVLLNSYNLSSTEEKAVYRVNNNFEKTLQLAESGNSYAQYEVGEAYFYGYKVERNFDKSIEWLTKSFNNKNPEAALALAGIIGSGITKQEAEKPSGFFGIEDNAPISSYLFNFSKADKNTQDKVINYEIVAADVPSRKQMYARFRLATHYLYLGNYAQAIKYFTLSADQGYINSIKALYQLYSNDIKIENNPIKEDNFLAYIYGRVISLHYSEKDESGNYKYPKITLYSSLLGLTADPHNLSQQWEFKSDKEVDKVSEFKKLDKIKNKLSEEEFKRAEEIATKHKLPKFR
jgi:hypothetical protein